MKRRKELKEQNVCFAPSTCTAAKKKKEEKEEEEEEIVPMATNFGIYKTPFEPAAAAAAVVSSFVHLFAIDEKEGPVSICI